MNDLKKILHIEDDGLIQAIVKASLKAIGGLEVLCVSSGKEALEIVGDYSPDLILLDVVMPGMDGPETLKKLKEKIDMEHTPVIFMTAKVTPEEIEHYRTLGASGVIIKPFDPMTLHEEINKIVRDFSKSGKA
ncbi:Response regulator receiver domain-containing protein [Azotobacter beijerinckii]|uniref:Response regulator receiver domain-containing protein n=1 Tax=Azotobacter beijerinckii TaxID=170623 RepID=A0A1H8ZYB0_9GAMM|nr:response regulator [Azotobacter beijerinckii]SEP69430.1 Response regulator receiver domain-containing protein [Azotobacter beijerinckii]